MNFKKYYRYRDAIWHRVIHIENLPLLGVLKHGVTLYIKYTCQLFLIGYFDFQSLTTFLPIILNFIFETRFATFYSESNYQRFMIATRHCSFI